MFERHASYTGQALADIVRVFGFVVSPLKLARSECERLLFFHERGFTMGIGHLPTQGGTAPVTIAGSMTLALAEPSRGVGFVFVYAMGLAAPFLVTAALLTRGVGWLRRLNRHMRAVEIVSGLLMVGVGILLITGTFTALNTYFIRITPEWLTQYL